MIASNGTAATRHGVFADKRYWDPQGRLIAHTGKVDTSSGAPSVLRVVQVATGLERKIPLPPSVARDARVTDWSSNGKLLGIVAGAMRGPTEYWVVQGLQEGVR